MNRSADDLSPETIDAIAGEPEIIEDLIREQSHTEVLDLCPSCGSTQIETETATDPEGVPRAVLIVSCAACGREIGELSPPAPASEAEPELADERLLPGPDEGPRAASGSRRRPMVIVYLKNGHQAEVVGAVDVRIAQFRAGLPDDEGAPLERGIHCYDAENNLVGLFRFEDVAGYALTEPRPAADFYSTISEQE